MCRNKNTLPLQNPVRHFYCFYKGQTIVNDCSIHHSSSPFAFDRIYHRSSAIKLLQNILLGTLWVRCSMTLNTSISALSNDSQAFLKLGFRWAIKLKDFPWNFKIFKFFRKTLVLKYEILNVQLSKNTEMRWPNFHL